MHPPKIARYLGMVLLFLGGFMATALPFAWLDRATHPVVEEWLISIGVTVGAGILAVLWGRRASSVHTRVRLKGGSQNDLEITRREALVIVSAVWLLCSVFGGLPLRLDGMVHSAVDAFFEAASGFTTTGSSILTEIEGNSRASLWWRSMIQWLGGMGIVVLVVAIIPQVGSGGRRLFESEAPGPTKDQLRPRIRETGATLWRIYLTLTFALTALLFLEGMGPFDAVCHAMTTMATGGFSTKNLSVAAFDSAAIDATITVFMLLAGTNFGIYYLLLNKKQGWAPLRDTELWTYLAIFAASTLVVTWTLLERTSGDILHALRLASFQVSSLVTSTGFATDDFNVYPPLSRGLLMVLMFVGAMGGSTAGGYKVSRLLIALSAAVQEIRHVIHPKAVFTTRVGGRGMDERVVHAAMALLVITLVLLVLSTLSLCAMGLSVETALSASMTAIANSGPGLNELGPLGNFAAIPDPGKVILSLLMVLGRLECYTMLALLVPGFWRGGR